MSENKFIGMRAEDEGDRTAEFKAEREKFVTSVNDWLVNLAAKRDSGEPLSNGLLITDKARITRHNLGKIAANVDMMVEDRQPGVSIEGDGLMSPLKLQAALPNEGTSGSSLIEVTGSDPLARQYNAGDYNSQSSNEVVAQFTMTDLHAGSAQENYFGYTVRGDGSVIRKHITPGGAHSSAPVRSAEDIQLAQTAFAEVQSQIA